MNVTHGIVTLPAELTEITNKLVKAAAASQVVAYTYSDGDACCEEHDTGLFEAIYDLDERDAARIVSAAYVEASGVTPPSTDLHVVEIICATLQGDDLVYSDDEQLRNDARLAMEWTRHVGIPNRDSLEEALTQELLNASGEEIMVKTRSNAPGAREVIGAEHANEWVRPLGEGDAANVALLTLN